MARIYHEDEMGALRLLFEEQVLAWPSTSARKIFGCPGYRRAGTLFAFLRDGAVVVSHLSGADRARFAAALDATPFTYPDLHRSRDVAIAKWLQVAYRDEGDLEAILPVVRAGYLGAAGTGTGQPA